MLISCRELDEADQTTVKQFGDPSEKAESGYAISSSDQSLWVSIIQVGEVVGSLAAGPIG